jgi:energy-coupling factor transporter ATP-binding protein EcfA2
MPLVSGAAWDTGTAQLALIAENYGPVEPDQWRQLLFAGSGLRHHLVGDRSAAFGTPVILAVVDRDTWRAMRTLAEDLAENYVLFNRIDLNLVLQEDLADDEKLDDALAPLLPRCRTLLGREISKGEVQRFWGVLEHEVHQAALGLDPMFGDAREAAGRDGAAALIGNSAGAPALPAPTPIKSLSLRNFRSAREIDVDLADITVIHGPNGGGKTSLLEALELVWAGTSQRKPSTVSAEEYERHLPRNGRGGFAVAGDEHEVTGITDPPLGDLARCVLTQEAIAALVSNSPEDRYSVLLTTTGLEIPDLKARTGELLDKAKSAADAALSKARLPTLPRRDSHGPKHLASALSAGFRERLPDAHELMAIEETLVLMSEGSYQAHDWPRDERVAATLMRADDLIEALPSRQPSGANLGEALDTARSQVASLMPPRVEAARAIRRLLDAIGSSSSKQADKPASPDSNRDRPSPVPPQLAVRWLTHARGLRVAAERFRHDAEALEDPEWAGRLRAYADAVAEASSKALDKKLERFAKPGASSVSDQPTQGLRREVYLEAGFTAQPADLQLLIAPLRELAQCLQQQADMLEVLAQDLASHPGRHFEDHAAPLLDALCRFELARSLRREGPILSASEQLVSELLQGRLAPAVRELVAAIVRFEWYFQPLLMADKGRKIVLGGLATSQADLDARLVLNSAERTVLGLAWFLALHMLQPTERRRVLVLDDPTSAFDAANQAGFISTLRAFVRLTRPEQILVATHDDAVAAMFSEELAPVDDWPSSVARVRCQRDSEDCSVVTGSWTTGPSTAVASESEQLGLRDEPSAAR